MNLLARIATALLLVAVCEFAIAGQVDLDLRATVVPPGPYRPGQSVLLRLTLTNLGPDVAGGDVVGDLIPPVRVSSIVRVNDAYRLPLVIGTQDPITCPLEVVPFDPAPGDREGVIYVVYFPRLGAGMSFTCTLDVLIDASQIIEACLEALAGTDEAAISTACQFAMAPGP